MKELSEKIYNFMLQSKRIDFDVEYVLSKFKNYNKSFIRSCLNELAIKGFIIKLEKEKQSQKNKYIINK